MRRRSLALLAAALLALAGSGPLEAQSFFAGKTVRIVVGLAPGGAIPVVQATSKPLADLPKVSQAISLAKTDEVRRLIQVGNQDGSAYSRPFIGPPGTPKDRVQVLRKAFVAAFGDRALRAEADKAQLTLDPVSGAELERLIAGLFALEPAFVDRLKSILHR